MLATAVLAVMVAVLLGGVFYLAVLDKPATPAAVKLDTPQAVAARLRELGAPCENLAPISDVVNAKARSSCRAGGSEIIISTYESHAAVEQAWLFYRELLLGYSPQSAMALGDVWTVSGDNAAYVRRAAQLLGGEYRSLAPSPSAAASTSAADVLAQFGRAGLPMSNTAVQDETTDPNNLLGRPNGYLSRASFDVTGGDQEGKKYDIERGGVIEVWADEAAARARSAYIQEALKSMPILGTEYHYVRGPVLLRITGKVKPSAAAQFETALQR